MLHYDYYDYHNIQCAHNYCVHNNYDVLKQQNLNDSYYNMGNNYHNMDNKDMNNNKMDYKNSKDYTNNYIQKKNLYPNKDMVHTNTNLDNYFHNNCGCSCLLHSLQLC